MVSVDEILRKYEKKLESDITPQEEVVSSRDYLAFKREMIPEISGYEKWAKSLGSIIKIKVSEKDRNRIQKDIDEAHLDITPGQALLLSALSFLSVFLLTFLVAGAIYFINGGQYIPSSLFALVFLGLITSIFIFYYTYTLPHRLANAWKLKASSQMVPAILYLVIYMKHTSNLERAIEFTSEHLEGPLALDFKKLLYDVEIAKYSTVKQALDGYLEKWNDYSPEFVEAFHLIESSLYEPSESRRVAILEKSLQIILDGVYEKMLKYSREIRSPLTNIYMLGIILPTLGLALLPLASTLLQGAIKSYHVIILFDIIIPFMVFFMTAEVLLKRPGGYGDSSILELNPDYPKYISKKPYVIGALIAIPLLIIAAIPFILQVQFVNDTFGLKKDYTFGELGIPFMKASDKLFEFREVNVTESSLSSPGETIDRTSMRGPFGPTAVFFSFLIPLGAALFFSTAYRRKTKELMKSRDNTKTLEEEFTNSLFQLGNRLGDGIPAEIAFSKVAESTRGQKTQQFFIIINQNIQQLGMSVESAIFDKRRGAIIYFPSAIISTSMRILIESSKKGLQVAARSLMSISEYVKNINKINERLRDLLAEVVSDMKSNMVFMAPLLSGIITGLASIITIILLKLRSMPEAEMNAALGGVGGMGAITNLFNPYEMIPPYFLQAAIGIYLVEIVFILTIALVTVDSGKDALREKYEIAGNLKKGITLYLIAAIVSTLVFLVLANTVINFG